MGNYFKSHQKKEVHQILRDLLIEEGDIAKFFVPLKCILKRYKVGEEIIDDNMFLPQNFQISFDKKQLMESQKLFNFLFNKFQHKGSIVIMGYFGSGKTTLAKKIEQFILKNMKQTEIPIIPIYINLQEIGKFNFTNFRQILTTKFYSFNLQQIQQFEADLAQRKFNIVIIMDCFEKLLLKKNSQKREKLLQQSFQFQQMYLTFYVVTTEVIDDKRGSEWFKKQPNVLTFQLQNFKNSEALEFFYQYQQFDLKKEISKQIYPEFQEIPFFTKDCEKAWKKIIMKDYEDIEDEISYFKIQLIDELQCSTYFQITALMLECIENTISNHLERILQAQYFFQFLEGFGFQLKGLTPFFILQIIDILEKQIHVCSFSLNEYLGQLTQEIFLRKLNKDSDEKLQSQSLLYFQMIFALSQGHQEQKIQKSNFTTKISYIIYQNVIKYQQLMLDFFIAKQIGNTVDQLPIFETYEEMLANIKSEKTIYCNLKNSSFLVTMEFSSGNLRILQLLKEMFDQNEQFQRRLITIIQASSVIDNYEKVASNAFMILKQLKAIYQGENFKKIRIKDCNLNGMFFHQCNFRNSIMENVNISSCWFNECCLDEVDWQKMQSILLYKQNFMIGMRDYVEKLCDFTPDGKNLFLIGSDCTSYLNYSLEDGKLSRILSQEKDAIISWEFYNKYFIFIADFPYRIRLIHIEMNKCVKLFYPHNKQISQIKLSPNKEIFASGSEDKKIKLWDMRNKKILRIFKGFRTPIQSFSFTSNSKLLASSTNDRAVRIWEIFSGIQQPQLNYHFNFLRDVVFSPSGEILASCGDDAIRLWNYREQKEIEVFKEKVNMLAFTSNEKMLISGGIKGKIIFWDIESGIKTKEVLGHNFGIEKIVISPGCKFLASFSSQDGICLWDIQTIINTQQFDFKNKKILQIEFSFDDSILACMSKSEVAFWNLKLGRQMKVISNQIERHQLIKFSSGELKLAYCTSNKLFFIDPFKGTKIELLRKSRSHIKSIAFSVNGELIFICCFGGQIEFIFKKNGKLLKQILYRNEKLNQIKTFSNDKIFAGFSQDYIYCMWSLQTLKFIRKQRKSSGYQQFTTLEVNEEIIASSDQKNLYLVDIKTGNLLATVDEYQINLVHLSSKLNINVSYSQNNIKILDLSGYLILKTIVKNFQDNNVSAKISPRGNFLASQSNGETINICKITKKQIEKPNLNQLQSGKVCAMAFSKLNQIIASAYCSKSIILWDPENNKRLTKLKAHKNIINQLCFSQLERLLLSCCQNHEIYLWQINERILIGKFYGNEKAIISLTISIDETIVASANIDNIILTWNVESGRLTHIINSQNRILEISFSDNCLISLSRNSIIKKWNLEEHYPQGVVVFKNTDIIVASQVLSEKKLLTFVNASYSIFILNLTNFKILCYINAPAQKIQSIAFSENGDQVGWLCENQFIYLWNVQKQARIKKLECPSQIYKQFFFISNYQIGYCKLNGIVSTHDIKQNKVYELENFLISKLQSYLEPLCILSKNHSFYSRKTTTFNAKIQNWQNLNLVNLFEKF